MFMDAKMGNWAVVIVDYGSLERTMKYICDFNHACIDDMPVSFVVIDNWDLENREKLRKDAGFVNNKYLYRGWGEECAKIYSGKAGDKDILLITVDKNLGYAKANNLGAKFALENLDAQYVIFSNNDIIFPRKFSLKTFEEIFAIYSDCLIIGPEVIGIDGARQGPIKNNRSPFSALIRPYSILRLLIKDNIEYGERGFKFGIVHHVMGCFLVTRIDLFKQIGMFDENTFLAYEEDILSEKARQLGYKFYFDSTIRIIHEKSMTTGKWLTARRAQIISFNSAYYYYKNYMHANSLLLAVAKINFYCIFIPLLPILKRVLKKRKRL